jgi:hypothetical protein
MIMNRMTTMARGKYFGSLLSVLVIVSPFCNRPDCQDALRNNHDYFMLTLGFTFGACSDVKCNSLLAPDVWFFITVPF